MKRNILAVSVAAALGMVAGTAVAAPTLKVNGVGMVNVIPYFSTQGSNVTQISITNTDLDHGKAVKVRFRGAEWSDDVFDFTVFMSPGDVFTGAVTNNGAGVSTFATSDASCTLPATVNQAFPTFRLANPATGTLEGYVEVINMGDIMPEDLVAVPPEGVRTSALSMNLFDAIVHVDGVAPCKTVGSAAYNLIQGLDEDSFEHTPVTGTVGQDDSWIFPPTTGLTSWNRVIDISAIKAFGVPAMAYDHGTTQDAYFRQANVARTPTVMTTADQIFFTASVSAGVPVTGVTAPITAMYQFDMPDLSTTVDVAYTLAADQRDAVTSILQKASVMTEFSTLASVSGATDVVLTQPTRRYYYDYVPHTFVAGDVAGTDYSRMVGTKYYAVSGEFLSPYEDLTMDNRVPLADLVGGIPSAYGSTPAVFWDREERFNATAAEIVISPTPPSAVYSLSLKGEASVVSFNRNGATATGALGAVLTMNDITVQGGYQTGWALLSTTASIASVNPDLMLPVIGFTAINVAGGNNYGTTLPLRYFGATGALSH